jgi:EAL domain-containing protein (putative c-di-GMP-specific phosphodiesterase class I)
MKIGRLVLENALRQNAKYTSHKIKKEIVSVNVRKMIHDDIENSRFCIIID